MATELYWTIALFQKKIREPLLRISMENSRVELKAFGTPEKEKKYAKVCKNSRKKCGYQGVNAKKYNYNFYNYVQYFSENRF